MASRSNSLPSPDIPASTPADGLPTRERNWAMLSIGLSVGMASVDTAIANTALPTIAAELHATPADAVWVVSIYQLAMVATLLPLAALSERIGYRRMSLFGIALFTLASLGCASAHSLPALIVARLLQGLGASASMSVNGALLRTIYPAKIRGRGFGMNALVVAVAFALGPSLASLILTWASWPWLFAVNLPLGILAFLVARRMLPETALTREAVDLVAAGLNAAAFGLLILALNDAARLVSPSRFLPEFAVAALMFFLLVRRERGQAAPMLPTDLFRRPLFALSAATAVCTFATQSLAFVSLPFYFETALGRSQVETGYLMTPWPVLVGIMAPIAGRLSDRHPAGLLGGIGLAALALGMLSLFAMPAQPDALAIGWRMALCGMGFGFFQAPNLKAIMTSAPPERSGGASGIVATARLTGQATGAALVALCLSVSQTHGAGYALVLGAIFAALASVTSVSRLFVAGRTKASAPR